MSECKEEFEFFQGYPVKCEYKHRTESVLYKLHRGKITRNTQIAHITVEINWVEPPEAAASE